MLTTSAFPLLSAPLPLPKNGMVKKNIDLPIAEIAALCDRWQIDELALFGSQSEGD